MNVGAGEEGLDDDDELPIDVWWLILKPIGEGEGDFEVDLFLSSVFSFVILFGVHICDDVFKGNPIDCDEVGT